MGGSTAEFVAAGAGCLAIVVLLAAAMGRAVEGGRLSVAYSRKVLHLLIFALPLVGAQTLPEMTLSMAVAGTGLLALAVAALLSAPLRRRVGLLRLAHLSFDRPEDRPRSLALATSQVLAGSLVLVPLMVQLDEVRRPLLAFLPLVMNALGDGLAEPVGHRIGRHRYRVPSLQGGGPFFRSLEGSAAVWFGSALSVAAFFPVFGAAEFWPALLLLPALVTAAEAWSPHGWDTPFILAAGGLGLGAILLWIP